MKYKPTRQSSLYHISKKTVNGYIAKNLRGGTKRFNKVYQDYRTRHSIHVDFGGTLSFIGHQPSSAPAFSYTPPPRPDLSDIIPPPPERTIIGLRNGQKAWLEDGITVVEAPDSQPVLIEVPPNIPIVTGNDFVANKVVIEPGVTFTKIPDTLQYNVYEKDGAIMILSGSFASVVTV